jgi:pimeloyl-ACP methyl ester carboxylesterase
MTEYYDILPGFTPEGRAEKVLGGGHDSREATMNQTDRLDVGGPPLGGSAARWPLDPHRPSLVLLHGSGGSRLIWTAQIKPLGRRLNTAALDFPGHGRTPGPALASVAELADWTADALDRIDPPRPLILGGVSLGGAVALETAFSRPDRIDGLVLISTAARFQARTELIDWLRRDYQAALDHFAGQILGPGASPVLAERTRQTLEDAPPDLLPLDLAAGQTFDRTGQLDQVRVPALVIHGTEDRVVPLESSRALAEGLPRAESVELEKAGHLAVVEQFQAVNQAVLGFVGRNWNLS